MKVSPPPPRSSAIGPLVLMSRVERSVVCVHCQKAHDRGFIWNFSETVRVCFTCYREMGEDARKSYERKAARGKGHARKIMGILALLIVILCAGACFLHPPLTRQIAVQRIWAGESRNAGQSVSAKSPVEFHIHL